MIQPGRYFFAVDLLRFCAALSVVAFHLCFYAWASSGSTTAAMFQQAARFEALAAWTWFGWVGVEVFFVISGFVIANSAASASPLRFVVNRALRLYPAAWICATVTLAALLFWRGSDLGNWGAAYLRSLALSPVGPWVDGVYWTLGVEIAFYAAVFALLALKAFDRIGLLAWSLTLLSALYFATDRLAGFAYADLLLFRHGAYFALGLWLWLGSEHRFSFWSWPGVALATGCALLQIAQRAHELGGEAPTAFAQQAWIPALLWLTALAALTLFALHPERFTPKSARVRAVLRSVGLMTYPLYLTHNVVGAGAMRALIEQGAHPVAALALAVVLALVLSAAVALWLEPALRRGTANALQAAGKRLSSLRRP